MAEIVNLRRARRQKARSAASERAAENRVAFGTSKHVKAAGRAAREADERRHDGNRREFGSDAET